MDQIQRDGPVNEAALVDLIERAQHNFDSEAFDGLYLLFADRVYRYLLAQLGDAEAAEEITSQVFVRLIERINVFRIESQNNASIFSGWLYRMAYNRMVDALRAEKRYRRIALEYAKNASQVEHNIPSGVMQMLDMEEILRKLRCLNAQQRDVIILRFVEELSIAETARIMEKSEAAIKALQQRALESLRNYRTM